MRILLPLVAAGACSGVLAGCSSAPATSPRASPVPAEGTGCVTQAEAMRIWTQVDTALNAAEADPAHSHPEAVATGTALQAVQQYLAQQLIANHWTEKEVDRLASLTVVDAGCDGGSLQVRVSMTLIRDDYLKPDGQVDHPDPSVGMTLRFLDVYVRSGGVWKESDFQSLDQPAASPTPQLL